MTDTPDRPPAAPPAPSLNEALAGIVDTYRQRDRKASYTDWRGNLYHPRHDAGVLFAAQTRAGVARALNRCEIELDAARVLDFGCGTGAWLRLLIDLGARPSNCFGVDLSLSRLQFAARQTPGSGFAQIAGELPFAAASFDLAVVSLVFSSIPERDLHPRIAAELERVVAPAGHLLWLDLERPSGSLHGFGMADLRRLFPHREPILVDRLHPTYIRSHHRRMRLLNILYNLTRRDCENALYVLAPRRG